MIKGPKQYAEAKIANISVEWMFALDKVQHNFSRITSVDLFPSEVWLRMGCTWDQKIGEENTINSNQSVAYDGQVTYRNQQQQN